MFYIYILLLSNNLDLIVSSDVTINKISNLPDFIEIKKIIKEADKKQISVIFNKIVKESKSKIEILDNLDLDSLIIVDAVYSDTIESLEKEIEQLTSIRQIMLKYDKIIKATEFNFNDLLNHLEYQWAQNYSLSNFISDNSKLLEYQKLSKLLQHNQINIFRRNKLHLLDDDTVKNLEKLNKIDYGLIKQRIDSVNSMIHQMYSLYYQENKILETGETDTILQLYIVKHYNNKLKKELKTLVDKHGSIESIINKLIFAYSKILETL